MSKKLIHSFVFYFYLTLQMNPFCYSIKTILRNVFSIFTFQQFQTFGDFSNLSENAMETKLNQFHLPIYPETLDNYTRLSSGHKLNAGCQSIRSSRGRTSTRKPIIVLSVNKVSR